MNWWEKLEKKRGSRPRCVLLMDGSREEVADRLTQLVSFPGMSVSPDDRWMPYGKPVRKEDGSWDTSPADEALLDRAKVLLRPEIRNQLRDWWLAHPRGANTPNWDIASTCTFEGERGLLLIEAKAHGSELKPEGKSLRSNASPNSIKNHERIGLAVAEANAELQSATGRQWFISRDDHYQLSNRFAWSWKLASLGIPVVLLYLGFLNAQDMACDGRLFRCEAEWERVMKEYCEGIVDESCWGRILDIAGVALIPLIRGVDQHFEPCSAPIASSGDWR